MLLAKVKQGFVSKSDGSSAVHIIDSEKQKQLNAMEKQEKQMCEAI